MDIVHFCALGNSLTAYAVMIGTTYMTLLKWKEKYPDFALALEVAEDAQQAYWERLALEVTVGNLKGNASSLIFMMKNRFKKHYKDKQEVEHSGDLQFLVDTGIRRDNGVESIEMKDSDYL